MQYDACHYYHYKVQMNLPCVYAVANCYLGNSETI